MEQIRFNNHLCNVHIIEDLWVEYNGDVYYVDYVNDESEEICLTSKRTIKPRKDLVLTISSDLSFKHVTPPKTTSEYVIYNGHRRKQPTLTRVLNVLSFSKDSYHLYDEHTKTYFWATPYEVTEVTF